MTREKVLQQQVPQALPLKKNVAANTYESGEILWTSSSSFHCQFVGQIKDDFSEAFFWCPLSKASLSPLLSPAWSLEHTSLTVDKVLRCN